MAPLDPASSGLTWGTSPASRTWAVQGEGLLQNILGSWREASYGCCLRGLGQHRWRPPGSDHCPQHLSLTHDGALQEGGGQLCIPCSLHDRHASKSAPCDLPHMPALRLEAGRSERGERGPGGHARVLWPKPPRPWCSQHVRQGVRTGVVSQGLSAHPRLGLGSCLHLWPCSDSVSSSVKWDNNSSCFIGLW